MNKILYISTICLVVSSCVSQKEIKKKTLQPATATTKVTPKEKKPEITHIGNEDFYKINIADASKNNSTVSFGSIVSAKLKHYRVTKTYFPAVGQGFRQRYIILHYTALDNERSVRVLTQQAVSSHYLINDLPNDEIYQLVDENKRAYHAGISHWRNNNNLNDSSIGIEIVNTGYTTDSSGKKQFEPFPEHQIKKVATLVKDLAERYLIPPTHIIAHSDISPTRKQDPGPLFPWKRLYDEYQIGMWYDGGTKEIIYPQALSEVTALYNDYNFIIKVQQNLRKFGYDIQLTGTWDKQTMRVLEAFQYHFRPYNYNGILDAESWAILQALNQKYN